MSSPYSSPRSVSRRSPSKGAPLAERSPSQTNRPSLRLLPNNSDEATATVFSSTPFPTKPAHVLLPDAIRERRVGSNDENSVPGAVRASRLATANTKAKKLGSDTAPEGRVVSPVPTLTLKRSVKALRDLYEAQAERSRPSTATSPLTSPMLRPSTASSGLRSFGSRDGLKGAQAWELFHKAYSDEIGTLPSLDEVAATVRQIDSQSSLTAPEPMTPNPNAWTYQTSSSPPPRPMQECSSPNIETVGHSSTSGDTAVDSSSPNVARLEESSSPTATSANASSPNVVKLGSSSPSYTVSPDPGADEGLEESPATVRRSLMLAREARSRDSTSFAARMQDSDGLASSPPDPLHSSSVASSAVDASREDAPYPASSPPFDIATTASGHSTESENLPPCANMSRTDMASESHTNLQVAIASSPAPSLQYPIIRAPRLTEPTMLRVAKRSSRSMADRYNEKWDARLSTVPSEWSREKEGRGTPMFLDHDTSTDTDTSDDDDSLQPPARAYLASSRGPSGLTIRMVSEADQREATDSVADLRPSEYRTPQLQQRSSAIFSMLSTSGSRPDSMRNSMDTRLNSMRSFTSSRQNSITRSVTRPGSSSSSLASNLPIPTWARRYYSGTVPKDYFYAASQISSTISLAHHPSTSAPRTPVHQLTSIFRPRTRPRLPSPGHSHQVLDMGPLVSHPVQPRSGSIALDPADPRAHWAGVDEMVLVSAPHGSGAEPSRPYSPYRFFPYRREWSPHLHQDPRLGGRSRWRAPSMDEKGETLLNWRNAQVLAFILGFACPLSWFIAAFALPLPPKPSLDMEQVRRIPTPNVEARMQQKMDIAADIRYENARWWQGLNRIMCAVGVALIALVITLAVIYR